MSRDVGFLGQFRPTDDRDCAISDSASASSGWTGSGSDGVLHHGEIYNSADLCRQLGLPRNTQTASLLLAGWMHWGKDLFQRIDGVFAVAIRHGGRLWLYRDPSGLRNLYMHTGQRDCVSFGTDLNRLIRLPGVKRRLARHSLHEYLRFGDISAPHTIYEDVRAVQAGHLVCWSRSGIEADEMAVESNGVDAVADLSDAMDALAGHLTQSVERRLEGVHRPASFLSGGIDSALLCSIASRGRKDLTAITVGFDTHGDDESPVAQRIAAHLGIKHEVLRFSRRDYLSSFERLCADAEQPIADPALAATLLVFQHCRHRFEVVIDGTGADEGMGLMPPRHVRLAVEYASLLPNPMRAGLTRLLRSVPPLMGYSAITDFEHPADTMIRWHGFTRLEIERLCGESVSFAHTEFYRVFHLHPRRSHFSRYSALINTMPSERISQAMLLSGLQVRFPFWDRSVDQFIRSLPVEHRYMPDEPKRILRLLLSRYVPQAIWNAPKHGFNFPLCDFLSGDNHALVKRLKDPAPWRGFGQLDHEAVRSYAQRFIEGDTRLTFRVWELILLGAFLERSSECT